MDFSKFQSHLSNLDKLQFLTPTRPFFPLLFPTQIACACLRASQHDLAITCFYACSDAVSVLVIRVGGSLQTVVKVFTDVLRTSACCVSQWRGDQQSGQYDHAKHEWHLALRYRHFSLPQSSSASRFTVGASGRSVPNCMWWFENGQCNSSDAVGRLSLWRCGNGWFRVFFDLHR